jgi:hypothetical protein
MRDLMIFVLMQAKYLDDDIWMEKLEVIAWGD